MVSSITICVAALPSNECNSLITHIHSVQKSTVQLTSDVNELHSTLKKQCPDILIIDSSSKQSDLGIQLIRELRPAHPDLHIVPLVPATRRELVQELLSLNITSYIYTPIEPAEISIALDRVIELINSSVVEEPTPTQQESQPRESFHSMIGTSKPMIKLFDLITRIAADDSSTVLIRGESGTGKEMVAKAIHGQSARSKQNFVPVNCAAIPDDLLESELFGYTKGAFTGATSNKIGRIQYADGGSLFLDEIGDMKASLQAKLLRVLQEKEFEPVGALKPIPVDTRIIAATHCDLEELVKDGRFREDLYYRLTVIPLNIPPLKERKEDIPMLVSSFIDTYTIQRGREPFSFSPKAMTALIEFEWRGNVRELENLIQHMSILYSGQTIEFDDLPDKFMGLKDVVENASLFSLPAADEIPLEEKEEPEPSLPQIFDDIDWEDGQVDFRSLINTYETQLIVHAMRLTAGNKKEAARLLNLKRTTLLEKIKKKDLHNLWDE